MYIDPNSLAVLVAIVGALCYGAGFFHGRLTATARLVLDPVEEMMQRRRKSHLEREYAAQQNGHPREKCPLADE